MRPLFYIIRKTLKNLIKELARRPASLILYIILGILIIFSIVISLIMPGSNLRPRGSADVYGMIIGGILIVTAYIGINQGIENGSTFFRFADVNFLFTAPISPRKILIYGFIKQVASVLVVILFLGFQIPNITMNFPVKSHGIGVIYGGAFLLIISMSLIGMLVYSITSISAKVRQSFKRTLNVLIYLVIGSFLLALYSSGSAYAGANMILNNRYFEYIPFIGWFKAVFAYAVKDIDVGFYINLALSTLSLFFMAYGIYKLKTDYYEDVLAATERREEMLKLKKEGRGNINYGKKKLRKVSQAYSGSGARAVFYRQLLEYRKAGMFFIDRSTIMIIAVGVGMRFFMPSPSINFILFFSIYMLYFFSLQGKWAQELGKPYIYLIPDSSWKKVFYATLPESIKNAVDGLLLFTITGFMLKADIVTIILCAACYTTFGTIYIYGDILSRRLFGSVHSRNLSVFIKMFLIFFIIMPGIIMFFVLSLGLQKIVFIRYFAYLALIAYNAAASGLILLLNNGIFEFLELN
jgi:hypothetical protein